MQSRQPTCWVTRLSKYTVLQLIADDLQFFFLFLPFCYGSKKTRLIFAMKRRFFIFNLGFRIFSRGCKTETVLLLLNKLEFDTQLFDFIFFY